MKPTRAALVASFLGALTLASAPHASAERIEAGRTSSLAWELPARGTYDFGSPERDGRVRRTLPLGPRVVAERTPLGARQVTGPVGLANGTVVVGLPEGLWLRDGGGEAIVVPLGPVDARPAVLPSGDFLVAARDGTLSIITPRGVVRAQRNASAGVRSAPLVLEDGSFVLSSLDRVVSRYAGSLERRDGTLLPAGLVFAPSRLGPARIAVSASDRLYVFDLAGTTLAQVALGERAVSPATITESGHALVLLVDGTVVESDGTRVLRRLSLGGRPSDSAAIAVAADGSLRIAIPTRGIVALDPNGSERWATATDAPFTGTLVVDDAGTTFAFDRRGRLFVLGADGAVLDRVELGGLTTKAPWVDAHGDLWVTTDHGDLVRIALAPT